MTTIATPPIVTDLLDLLEAAIDAQRIVDGLQGELAAAERALKEYEASITVGLLLNPEGPINGKNEATRQAQLMEWLAYSERANGYRAQRARVDAIRNELRVSQTLAEGNRLVLSVRREILRHSTARLMAGVQ